MAKLNKEAVGQYNYVVADDVVKNQRMNQQYAGDASVDLVVKHPRHLQLIKMDPPKMFETKYQSDYRPPPQENLICHGIDESKKYTTYPGRSKVKGASSAIVRSQNKPRGGSKVEKFVTEKNQILKSLLDRSKLQLPARAQTAEPAVARTKPYQEGRKTAEFQRDIVKGRPDWKHKEEKSFDVLNPEKPNQLRETNPYGAAMENKQENIAQKFMDDDTTTVRSYSSFSSISELQMEEPRPRTFMTASRASGRSNSTTSDLGRRSTSRKQTMVDVEMAHLLPTIQEEGENNEDMSKLMSGETRQSKGPERTSALNRGRLRTLRDVKKLKTKDINLFEKKAPDKRFYRSKIRQTPNEMNQYKKMRNRTFFKPLEQAINEKDVTDHEVKYEPERQLLKDARWRVRQDLKDVRSKNINSLVDRFAQRAELKNQERQGRLGLPTYGGRDPVSIYKLRDALPDGITRQPHTDITVQLPPRRRITPSIGSVQRARNLSTYANVWNQPKAPPYWGPQRVDHGLFLPPMAVNT